MVTISAVVFLYPANFKLASIAIVNMEDAGDIAPAAALAVLVMLTNIAVRLLYELISNRLKKSGEKKYA
jgi:iron(III) transport system permease protein